MLNNKKAVSQVIVIVFLVALVLVLLGVVWGFINNLVEGKRDEMSLTQKCMDIDLNVRSASCESGTCDITIWRDAGGTEIDGVRIVFFNKDETSSGNVDEEGNIGQSSLQGFDEIDSGLSDVGTIQVSPYFLDSTGEKVICSNKATYNVD